MVVQGLEEIIVKSSADIYALLDRGSAKRKTAETLLNKQSSRSHSVFCITVHIREISAEGEEVIKIGKLNLVDLAGSENVSRCVCEQYWKGHATPCRFIRMLTNAAQPGSCITVASCVNNCTIADCTQYKLGSSAAAAAGAAAASFDVFDAR